MSLSKFFIKRIYTLRKDELRSRIVTLSSACVNKLRMVLHYLFDESFLLQFDQCPPGKRSTNF